MISKATPAIAAVFIAMALAGSPANAQMSKSDCEALREPMASAATQMAAVLASIEKTGFAALGAKVGETEAKPFQKLMASRQDALPALRGYVTALQDFSYAMQVCARP